MKFDVNFQVSARETEVREQLEEKILEVEMSKVQVSTFIIP